MVKATDPPHRKHSTRSVTARQVMKELQDMIGEGRVDASRVIAFVKEKAKGRTGRPPIPEDERRTVVLQVRITPKEHQALQQAAKKRGVTVAKILREAIGRHAG